MFISCRAGLLQVCRLLTPHMDPHSSLYIRIAVFMGRTDVVEYLLDLGVDPKRWRFHLFKTASQQGHIPVLELLLSRVDLVRDDGVCLAQAMELNQFDVVSLLMQSEKYDIHAGQEFGLRMACYCGNTQGLQMLLDDPTVDPSASGHDALINACSNGNVEIVRMLLQDPRLFRNGVESRCLLSACRENRQLVVKLLLEDGRIDPLHQRQYALLQTCRNGFAEIMKMLLEDPRSQPQELELMKEAIQYQQWECLTILLRDERFDKRVRRRFFVEGNALSDCLQSLCCPVCTNVQHLREVRFQHMMSKYNAQPRMSTDTNQERQSMILEKLEDALTMHLLSGSTSPSSSQYLAPMKSPMYSQISIASNQAMKSVRSSSDYNSSREPSIMSTEGIKSILSDDGLPRIDLEGSESMKSTDAIISQNFRQKLSYYNSKSFTSTNMDVIEEENHESKHNNSNPMLTDAIEVLSPRESVNTELPSPVDLPVLEKLLDTSDKPKVVAVKSEPLLIPYYSLTIPFGSTPSVNFDTTTKKTVVTKIWERLTGEPKKALRKTRSQPELSQLRNVASPPERHESLHIKVPEQKRESLEDIIKQL
ncbi:ankyrin repeat-containing domain protein [Gorgonomyces haynaldii]|nr:ankyrin repeat-containing domain protein [Gorgonomyces haynaldii]